MSSESWPERDPFMEIPLRACGGNVLLRKVAMDIHTAGLIGIAGPSSNVIQVAEVVGLGGRWTQNRPWQPPMPAIRQGTLDDGSPDPRWKPPDLSRLPQRQPARFDEGHKAWLEDLAVGDLVTFQQARSYDVFQWRGVDILVFPGDWIFGKLTSGPLVDQPHLRRYMQDSFDTAAPDRKLRG